MNISDNTAKIIQNFASINPSLYFTVGNKLKTISPSRNVFATAKIDESFDSSFGIYDLSKFLSVISLFKEPDIELNEKVAVIRSGKQKVNYTFCDKTMIVTPPEKDLNLPEAQIAFELTQENLQSLLKAASVLQSPNILVVGKEGNISVQATNIDNTTSDVFSLEVGETSKTFSVVLKTESLKLLPATYQVSIGSGYVKFDNDTLSYTIASEKSSTLK